MAMKKQENRFDFSAFRYLNNYNAIVEEKMAGQDILAETRKIWIAANPPTGKDANGKLVYADYNFDYYLRILDDNINAGKKFADLSTWTRNWCYETILKQNPEWTKEIEKKFSDWYDATPAAQEVYKHVAEKTRYWYDQGKSIGSEEAKNRGWFDKPSTLAMFDSIATGWMGREYMEKNREQVFQEGDLVLLRLPYVGHWKHDPHYNTAGMTKEDKRYGTVMKADTDKLSNRGRNGKGTRLIAVMWFGKDGQIDNVEEKRIKFESRKRDH